MVGLLQETLHAVGCEPMLPQKSHKLRHKRLIPITYTEARNLGHRLAFDAQKRQWGTHVITACASGVSGHKFFFQNQHYHLREKGASEDSIARRVGLCLSL